MDSRGAQKNKHFDFFCGTPPTKSKYVFFFVMALLILKNHLFIFFGPYKMGGCRKKSFFSYIQINIRQGFIYLLIIELLFKQFLFT